MTALGAVAAGGFVFYNTAVLNHFASTKDIERRRVAYEQDYRRFKNLAQPRVVGVRIRADLAPEHRAFALRSVVRKVHVTANQMGVDFVVSERPLKAGVDPYNKLIDRTPEDNVRPVAVSP